MIHIIDYGLGNLGSIKNMLKKIGYDSTIIANPDDLKKSTKIILPGVGAFDTGIKNLTDGGWIEPLSKKVLVEKVPTLGICLGMQLMCKNSEEGVLPGLAWVNAEVKKFNFESTSLKIPHMGWNDVFSAKNSKLTQDDFTERRFYFVHSYYVTVANQDQVLFSTNYGSQFNSAFEKDNIIGVQFHPEKSHKFGLSLLKNFIEKY
ncbi:MAG: imidazole glycerol phosphate synthase subunit HisH [Pedobacter sp.]|nr:MAG: imidazole glycerol phosphate synthase subunit HisH [Pedobacter sp.]